MVAAGRAGAASARRVDWPLVAVLGATAIGLAVRLAGFNQSLFGDETSTLRGGHLGPPHARLVGGLRLAACAADSLGVRMIGSAPAAAGAALAALSPFLIFYSQEASAVAR